MTTFTRNPLGLALFGLFLGLCAGAAGAMDRPGPNRDRPGLMGLFDDVSPLERTAKVLGLSAEQRQAIKAIVERTRNDAKQYRDQLHARRGDMRSLLEADSFDEQQARELIAQKQQAMTELKLLHMRQRFEINAVLTPEQRAKLNDVIGRHPPGCAHPMP
jgi:protein CpxP